MNTTRHDFDVNKHLNQSQRRGLGSRPRLRIIAATAWISFMYGAAVLMIFLFIVPEPLSHVVRLDWLSGFFIIAWASGFATALLASFMADRIWSASGERPQ